ncbi:MAG TPA: DNA gyrase inhibitor YacG [Rhizomicrobium sp.]|jgi:endogenous inhibitor of DNA gyrase (YacG/DUF329 family)|nr:DNA gyrase inhibitor YacG [Rhizomicrobium sp.]
MSQPSSGGICPICGKPRDQAMRPFCSKRCADLDLARWLKGEYAIPGAPAGDENVPAEPEEDAEFH